MVPENNNTPRYTVLAVIVAILVGGVALQAATAGHQPADKGAATASDVLVENAPLIDGASSENFTLLTSTLKTSKGTDLLLSVSIECALWTYLSLVGNDDEKAAATVTVWIEVDGEPLGLTSGSDAAQDAAEVVFCNRVFRMETLNVDDEDQQIDTYLETRAAHAFNWVALDLGSGIHDIEVNARIDVQESEGGTVYAGVGSRTLIVEPTRFANDLVLS